MTDSTPLRHPSLVRVRHSNVSLQEAVFAKLKEVVPLVDGILELNRQYLKTKGIYEVP